MPNRDKFNVSVSRSGFSSKQVLNISRYLGLDYNPAQLQVATNHAVDASNIVFKDRVNQKRSPYEQLLKIEPYQYYVEEDGSYTAKTNSTHINGIWDFIGEDEEKHLVFHIGNILFIAYNVDEEHNFLEMELLPLVDRKTINGTTYNIAYEINDEKLSAFYQNNKLYILGGNKFIVLRAKDNQFVLSEVEDDEDTYIPVTTIGITYKDSLVGSRTPLDDVNLMTEWRKNKLVSGTYIDDGVTVRTTRFWDFELDTSVKCKNPKDINDIKINISSLREVA